MSVKVRASLGFRDRVSFRSRVPGTIVRIHVYSPLCHLNLHARNPLSIPFAHRYLSVLVIGRSIPKELDMNLTSLKVGIHRHCSINKLN